jgi:hypothetical protein
MAKGKPWWWDVTPPTHRLGLAIVGVLLGLGCLAFAIFDPAHMSAERRWATIVVAPLLVVFFIAQAIRAQEDEDNL